MKKVAIVYFSGTGNTKYVAEKMKEAANKASFEVDLINIEKDKINAEIYDYIIIGGPVYVERYPEILLRYAENNLSNYIGRCMMYSTQAFEGQTAVFGHAVKRLKHLNITYYNYVTMPNNFYTFMFKKCSEEKKAELIKEAPIKTQKMVLEFLDGKTDCYEVPKNKVVMAEVAYKLTYPLLRKFLMRKLSIDKSKCINCKVCEESCPTKSIKISPKLKIKNSCAFCQRCINKCPKNAFLYDKRPVEQYKIKVSK